MTKFSRHHLHMPAVLSYRNSRGLSIDFGQQRTPLTLTATADDISSGRC